MCVACLGQVGLAKLIPLPGQTTANSFRIEGPCLAPRSVSVVSIDGNLYPDFRLVKASAQRRAVN